MYLFSPILSNVSNKNCRSISIRKIKCFSLLRFVCTQRAFTRGQRVVRFKLERKAECPIALLHSVDETFLKVDICRQLFGKQKVSSLTVWRFFKFRRSVSFRSIVTDYYWLTVPAFTGRPTEISRLFAKLCSFIRREKRERGGVVCLMILPSSNFLPLKKLDYTAATRFLSPFPEKQISFLPFLSFTI